MLPSISKFKSFDPDFYEECNSFISTLNAVRSDLSSINSSKKVTERKILTNLISLLVGIILMIITITNDGSAENVSIEIGKIGALITVVCTNSLELFQTIGGYNDKNSVDMKRSVVRYNKEITIRNYLILKSYAISK